MTINNLRITSPGNDNIHPKITKQISTFIALPLTHIINTSLVTGVVPSKSKIAKAMPIFEAGQCDDMYNYRPMTILPRLSKIMERSLPAVCFLFWKNLIFFKNANSDLFLKNTTHTISTLVDYVINYLENNEIPCSIFLDTSKAFDTIDHKILLNKLYMYGI